MAERARRRPAKDVSAIGTVVDYDVVLIADMTLGGEGALRVALEAAAYRASGKRVALAHLPSSIAGPRIAPDIQGLVSAGIADPVDPARSVTADLAVLHQPELLKEAPARLRGLRAGRVIVAVAGTTSFPAASVTRWLSARFGQVRFAPVSSAARTALAQAHPDLALAETDWLPFAGPATPERSSFGHRLILGYVGGADGAWPPSIDDMLLAFPPDGGFDIRFLGTPRADLMRVPNSWTIVDPDRMGIGRFLEQIDVLVAMPSDGDLPLDAIIATVLAAGKPVLLPRHLRDHHGQGPLYVDPAEMPATLRKFILDPVIRRSVRTAALSGARRLTQTAPPPSAPAGNPQRPRPRPVALLLASNGTGLGHVTRLLAIARRMDGFQPVFVSMAQAVDTIESFGFGSEYLPTYHYLGADPVLWERWYRAELEQLIDAYGAKVVVYDGNGPSPGLVEAVGSRGDCRLVWVRGGMAGNARVPFIDNAPYCDVIVEPGELAFESDHGMTAQRRDEAVIVDPILLLDAGELLSREDAAKALGLDPDRPAVLIQLGTGSNRDIVSVIDRVMQELEGFPDVQVALAEWSTGAALPQLWPRAKMLRGHPFAQYYRAFDFTISAAGYNTFHEIIAYGVPTIFIANTHPSMDDQRGRARYAEGRDLALELNERDLYDLPAMIKALLAAPARDFLAANCRKVAIRNGAADVARLLEDRFGASS